MKKSIIIMLGLALMSVQSFADTRAQALLLHNGQGKSFDANQLQEAVNEAVDGDTIYLSEGTFVTGKNNDDTLIVEKAVSIIGTGETTKLAGYVNIAIDGNPISNGLEFGRMHITKDLVVIKKMHGLKVSQCFIDGYFTATDTITGIKMDRCFARTFTPTQYIRSATVTNSIFTCIGSFYNDPKKAVYFNSYGCDLLFMNCNIYQISVYEPALTTKGGHVGDATFVNCMIDNIKNWDYRQEANIYTNCLLRGTFASGNTVTNCYNNSNFKIEYDVKNSYFIVCKLNNQEVNSEMLRDNGYIGTDGSVVGALGGATPFSMQADGLRVKESVLRVDPDTRQLNVTLKVEKQ